MVGSLMVSWAGAAANAAAEAKSVLGALAAGASLVASCYAIAVARRRLRDSNGRTEDSGLRTEVVLRKRAKKRMNPQISPINTDSGRGRGRKGKIVKLVAMGVCLVLGTGCSYHGKRLERAKGEARRHAERVAEVSRALTTGVADALAVAQTTNAAVKLAERLARADQEIEGLPMERLPVEEAIGEGMRDEGRGMSGAALREVEEVLGSVPGLRKEGARLERVAEAREAKLLEMGVKAEEDRNGKIWRRWKWGSGFAAVAGGLAAVFVLCPLALPIVGRLLGWMVGKVPSMAGAIGVVGADAFDAVVRGVGASRKEMKADANDAEELKRLDAHLRAETDRAHKRLIEERRAAVGV